MKLIAFLFIISSMAIQTTACKETPSVPSETKSAPVEAPAKDSPNPAQIKEEKPSKPSSSTQRIKGKGNGTDGKTATIDFTVNSQHQVSGQFSVDGKELRITGVLDGTILRCWIANESENPENLWRGTVLATISNDVYDGTFALSNNGAAVSIQGTWRSEG